MYHLEIRQILNIIACDNHETVFKMNADAPIISLSLYILSHLPLF